MFLPGTSIGSFETVVAIGADLMHLIPAFSSARFVAKEPLMRVEDGTICRRACVGRARRSDSFGSGHDDANDNLNVRS